MRGPGCKVLSLKVSGTWLKIEFGIKGLGIQASEFCLRRGFWL